MHYARVFHSLGFVAGIALAPLLHAQTTCTTVGDTMAIDTVEGNPFTADAVFTATSTRNIGTKSAGSTTIFHIARNRAGYVSIKYPVVGRSDVPLVWENIICDPQAGTRTRFSLLAHPEDTTIRFEKRAEVTRHFTSPGLMHGSRSTRLRDYAARAAKSVDLGYRNFDGISAYGFRLWLRREEASSNSKFTEEWFSDDLAADMLVIRDNEERGSRERATLTHITRDEPDPELFEVPPGYRVVDKDEKRSAQ